MLFTDPAFLFYFLPLALLVLRTTGRLAPGRAYMSAVTALTFVFYGFQRTYWIGIFCVTAASVYVAARALGATRRGRRPIFILGLSIPILLLATFKYLNWLAGIAPALAPLQEFLARTLGTGGRIDLPPGISFFTFEALSFLFDVYRGKSAPPRPLEYMSFLAMFPRFIAGPIVRFEQVHAQYQAWRMPPLARGMSIFALGFALKVLGADSVAEFVPLAFGAPTPGLIDAWVGVLAYSIQLYLDFWGYSLMATGIGLAVGLSFPDNFRAPYRARSVGDFWRRWHITLGTWLRDYLYVPLGGSRCGRFRNSLNLFATMCIAGLWHGANGTFVIWGALHGAALVVERWAGVDPAAAAQVWRGCLTFLFVILCWVVFRADSVAQAADVYGGMLGLHGVGGRIAVSFEVVQGLHFVLGACALLFVLFGERRLVFAHPIAEHQFSRSTQIVLGALFIASLIVCLSAPVVPFLYFRF